ncbi:MAG TPA: hypothetical protein VE175_13190 [Woeseiaceae bacterium]|nr:hypothetical protein [Woeseiaceae bacterium]
MDKRIKISLCSALFLIPATAAAYVGPGAGLSLLGALWALVVAIGTAIAFVVAWPVRRLLRRRRAEREEASRPGESRRREHAARRAAVPDTEADEALPSKRH